MPNLCVEVRDFSKIFTAFGREIVAVDGVSFGVREGEFVALLGPSGCGKSTVLNAIATLVSPSRGSVLIDGEPTRFMRPHPNVGYVFQRDTLFPWRTVEANVGYALEVARVPVAERRRRVAVALEQAGLSGFGGLYPQALSGGMRQRAALMRALIARPRILLMDEPFGALDAHTKIEMHRVLLRIWEQERQSVVFVTHDLGEALTLADRVILMSARPGRIKEEFAVEFPRPRDAIKLPETESYGELFSRVWHSLGQELGMDVTE